MNEATKQALKDYLKENLKIEILTLADDFGIVEVTAQVVLDGEVITKDSDTFELF